MDDLISFLNARLEEDHLAAYRVLHWPDDACQPRGRAGLFRHDRWVRRYESEDSGVQIIRTATDAEGQLPEGWERGRPVPEGWIGPHGIARIPEVLGGPDMAVWLGAHIARHDPARVLAEVEGKRRVLALCERAQAKPVGEYGEPDEDVAHRLALESVIRLLALPYADHPGYQEGWRP